ncbi:OmpH family outer membrane protein [Avrilella dinanensis]|nr:OmpH family outer membrane protein [Avrilella dinanensis]
MKGIFLFISILLAGNIYAQQKEKIAVVDLEYILKKVPEYQEQNRELRKRAKEWDIEIQKRKNEIKKQKDQLALERPLLTSQIIEEKEEEIALLEKELLDYQHQHFGLDGDYFIQKINLAKPIQEKIYAIINDYAQKRKFDMVLDKSDDTNGLLYTKKGVDISDRIVREIERSLRKERLTKKEIAQLEAQDEAEDAYLRQRSKRDLQEERMQELFNQKEGEDTKKVADDPISKRQQEAEKRKREAQQKREEQIRKRKEAIQKRKEEAQKRRQELIDKKNKAREEAQKKRQQRQEEQKKKINAAQQTSNNDSKENSAQDKINEILEKRKEAQEKREKDKEERLKAIEEAKENLNKN